MTKYPNRETLYEAHNIYRDVMRRFVVRCLKKIQGTTPEKELCRILNLELIDDPKVAIDINDFPRIIRDRDCWFGTFSSLFGSKGAMDIRGMTSVISDSRKLWAHPGTEDVDSDSIQMYLSLIAEVLDGINETDAAHEVKIIRDRLFSDEPEEHPAEAENADPKECLNDMSKQLDAAKGEIAELEKQVKTTSDRLKEVEAEWIACDERLRTMSIRLRIAVAGKTTAEERLSDISNRLEERLSDISNQLEEAERENTGYKKRIESISDQLEARNAEKIKCEKALKAVSNQLATLKSINVELEERLETTSTQLEDVETELTTSKEHLARTLRQPVDKGKRNAEDEGPSKIKEWRRKIWKQLCDYAAQKDTPVRFQKPGSENYLNVSRRLIDSTGFYMKVWLGKDNREITIRLYMSKQNFYILKKQRKEIEWEFCESLEWEELPQRRDSRISLRKDIIDPTDASDWQNQYEWVISKLEKFHKKFNEVFLPRIKELNTSNSPSPAKSPKSQRK